MLYYAICITKLKIQDLACKTMSIHFSQLTAILHIITYQQMDVQGFLISKSLIKPQSMEKLMSYLCYMRLQWTTVKANSHVASDVSATWLMCTHLTITLDLRWGTKQQNRWRQKTHMERCPQFSMKKKSSVFSELWVDSLVFPALLLSITLFFVKLSTVIRPDVSKQYCSFSLS